MTGSERADSTRSNSPTLSLPDSLILPLSLFDYQLPKSLIAQEPCPERDAARLMVVHRGTGRIEHRIVHDLPDLLDPNDLLVFNNTRVLPARLLGVRERTGGKWEGLFLREVATGHWELLCQTRGRVTTGEWIRIEAGPFRLRLLAKTGDGHWLAEPGEPGTPEDLLRRYGHVPLPPYIRKGHDRPEDRERYQTVFAVHPGAVAAPTAGLHFTPELLRRLDERGIGRAFVTLHVGTGTFQPIQSADVAAHHMHREWAELPEATALLIRDCCEQRGRVVAVGTTTIRMLESVAATGPIRPWSGETELFIRPPYQFRAVDVLLTNFHLPRSSLLVLVSAFAGIDLVHEAYRVAVEQGYRFYSYGDAMLLL